MPRPKGSKNKTLPKIAEEAIEKISNEYQSADEQTKPEIEEAITELSDLLGHDDAKEELSVEETPIADAQTPVSAPIDSAPGRIFLGRNPVTGENVYL